MLPIKPTPSRLSLAIASALAVAYVPAWAQTAPAPAAAASAAQEKKEETKQLERIVVTATGRAVRASEVPYNVTAISEEVLREENITDLKKLIANDVDVNAPGNSARFADSVTVRGLNVSPANANNLEQFVRSTLSYYLDDTPLPNIGFRIKDIARVEKLLGPQGTLYGAGSLGGVYRYITNQPEFGRNTGRINTSIYQTQGGKLSHDTDGVINLTLGTNVAMRISLARLDDKGFTTRISNPPWRTGSLAWTPFPNSFQNVYPNDDWTKTDTGRIALAWKATRDLKLTYSHAEQQQLANGTSGTQLLPLGIANANSPADVTSYINDPRRNAGSRALCGNANQPPCRFTAAYDTPELAGKDVYLARYPEFAQRQFVMDSFDVEYDMSFARLKSSTSRYTDSRVGQADYAGQGWFFYWGICGAACDAGGAFNTQRSAYITFDNSYKGLSHETRLTSKGDGPLSWIAGFYYTRTERSLRFSEFLPGMDSYLGINRRTAGGNADEGYRENLGTNYNETAIYGEVGYKITPQWLVNVGGRVFKYEDTGISQIRDYSFDLVNSNVNVTLGDSGKSYYKVNTSYQLNRDALVYGTASQGFRRGGTNGFRNFGTGVIAPTALQYEPDTTNNLEVGFKGALLSRKLYLQASVYQIDWKNVQTYRQQLVDEGFPINGTANGPDARSTGFEMSLRYNVTPNWSASLASAKSSAKFVATKTHCLYTNNTSCRTWYDGDALGGAPAWKHVFSSRYKWQFSNGGEGWVSVSGRYVASVLTDRQDTADGALPRERPAYTLYNLRAGYGMGNFDVSMFVENVNNTRAEVSQQLDRVLGNRLMYTTPRTVGVNLSYNFD